ncbi:hypothetical protein JE299_000222 [Salmonella enterica]|nr:hypothetical protein [Salmonella enterica]EGT7892447.1 hypothetical protein [Salmonella enterica]
MTHHHLLPRQVFPAPAGINRNFDYIKYDLHGVPRASGDKPPEQFRK